jgi:uncharacterized membrane protein
MTSDTSPYPQVPPPPLPGATSPGATPPGATPPAAAGRGWHGSDLAIGGALIVLLIALFLPWFSSTVRITRATRISGAGDGPAAHGYLWTVFVLVIVALIVLVARDAIAKVPGNLPSPEQILVGATGLVLLLTILGVVQKPSPVTVTGSGPVSEVFPHLAIATSWSYGGFVALVAAIVAFIAAFGTAGPLESAHRTARAAIRRPHGTA